MHFNKLRHIDD